MKKAMFLFLVLILSSCKYFEKNVPTKNDLLNKELKKINWEEVDEFPNLATCDSLEDKTARKACFFNQMTQNTQQKLILDSIKINFPKLDTISIKVTVFANATLGFEINLIKYKSIYNIKKLDSILQSKLANIPAVEPAIKRGVKVNSQFIIPIILN